MDIYDVICSSSSSFSSFCASFDDLKVGALVIISDEMFYVHDIYEYTESVFDALIGASGIISKNPGGANYNIVKFLGTEVTKTEDGDEVGYRFELAESIMGYSYNVDDGKVMDHNSPYVTYDNQFFMKDTVSMLFMIVVQYHCSLHPLHLIDIHALSCRS